MLKKGQLVRHTILKTTGILLSSKPGTFVEVFWQKDPNNSLAPMSDDQRRLELLELLEPAGERKNKA